MRTLFILTICPIVSEFWNWLKPKNGTDFIQALGAIITVIIAWKALNIWKKEKEHDILLEAYAFRKEANAYLDIIRNPIGAGGHSTHSQTYDLRKKSKKETVDKIRIIREKISFYIKNTENPLLQYYDLICKTDDNFNTLVGMLDFYSKEIDEKKKEEIDYKRDYDEYKKIYNELYNLKWRGHKSGIPDDDINKKLYFLEQKFKR